MTASKTQARPEKRRYSKPGRDLLDAAIIAAVAVEVPATVRSIFYRCVSAGAIPKTEEAYKRISERTVELRQLGLVSYGDISDGTRSVLKRRRYDNIADAIAVFAHLYRRNLWTDSDYSLILLLEKDAMSGVVESTVDRFDVPVGVMRGFASETFAWRVGQRMEWGKVNVIAQLGDHDPSGVDAWNNFVGKVRGFAPDMTIEAERLAVLPWQIEEWDLPTREPKKQTKKDIEFGRCVEVDAIPPGRVRHLVADWIHRYLDADLSASVLADEARDRDQLRQLAASMTSDGDL